MLSASGQHMPKKTPPQSVITSREPAKIRRVEPVLDGALAAQQRAVSGVATEGDQTSLVSKASTGPWPNQYNHIRAARRGKSGMQTHTPVSSAGGAFTSGGLRQQLDLNTEQTISNHDDQTRRFFNLISMRGDGLTGSKKTTPENRDLSRTQGATPYQ